MILTRDSQLCHHLRTFQQISFHKILRKLTQYVLNTKQVGYSKFRSLVVFQTSQSSLCSHKYKCSQVNKNSTKTQLWKIFYSQERKLYFSKLFLSAPKSNSDINIKQWIPPKSPRTAGIGRVSLGCICHFLPFGNKTPKHYPRGSLHIPPPTIIPCKSEMLAAIEYWHSKVYCSQKACLYG